MTVDDDCNDTRGWLSAQRDGESGPDDSASAHLERCTDCQQWADTFDHLTRQVRLRAPMATPAVTTAVARIADAAPPTHAGRLGQALLAFAAISGTLFLLLGATGAFGHSHLGSSDGRQAEALTIALLGGFALAAWRPARLAAGLVPVAVLGAAITVGLSFVEVAGGGVSVIDELSHLPLVVGAIGAAIASRTTEGSGATSANVSFRETPIANRV